MKKILLGIVVAAVAGFSACVQMTVISGNGITEEKSISFDPDYRELSVAGGITVLLSPTIGREAAIVADQQVMQYVSVTQSGGKVRVCYNPSVNVRSKIKTIITLPMSGVLEAVKVSSASTLHADNVMQARSLRVECSSSAAVKARVETADLNIIASAAANCEISGRCDRGTITASSSAKYSGELTVGELSVNISSAANCVVRGRADQLTVDANSSGVFDGTDLRAAKVFVSASSAASAKVWAVEELGVSLSSAATAIYKGEPRLVSQEISGGASLKKAE